jgi:hypothetical protein
MEASTKRGTFNTEYASRFSGAFRKLSEEIELANRKFVGGENVKLPAAEEIQSFEAGRERGIMDDPRQRQKPHRSRRHHPNVAGGKAHVAKLHKDLSKMREGVERVGLRLAEPIEVEYVGQDIRPGRCQRCG